MRALLPGLFLQVRERLESLALVTDLLAHHPVELFLVGGAVRDYFLLGHLGPGLDFELQVKAPHQHRYDDIYASVVAFLKDNAPVEKLPFGVLRVGDSLEMAQMRREVYHGPGPFSHSDFQAQILKTSSWQEGFRRRDLTINAMAVRLFFDGGLRLEFVDPYNGLEGVQKKIFRHCSEDYFFDPVRLLRLVRFQLRFEGFEFDPKLKDGLGRFHLGLCSDYHLLKEFRASQCQDYFRALFHLIDSHGVAYRSSWNILRPTTFFWGPEESVDSFAFPFWQSQRPDEEGLEAFAGIFGLKKSVFEKFEQVDQLAQSLEKGYFHQSVSQGASFRAFYDTLTGPQLSYYQGLYRLKRYFSFIHKYQIKKALSHMNFWPFYELYCGVVNSRKEEMALIPPDQRWIFLIYLALQIFS